MIQVHVYPFKCLVCRRTGKYSTAISHKDIEYRCPHDGSAMVFQAPVRQYTVDPMWHVSPSDVSNTIGDEFIDAVLKALAS